MIKDDILKLEIRKEIYNFIQKNPGLHLSKLSRNLKIPRSTLRYHLNYMKKNELISEVTQDKVTRFYISKKIGSNEKKYINLMRKKTSRRILLMFLSFKCLSRIELSRMLEMHPNTIDFHLKKLLKLGIIRPATLSDEGIFFPRSKNFSRVMKRNPVVNEVVYRLVRPGPRIICNILIKYGDNFIDDEISKILMDYINQAKHFKNHLSNIKKLPSFQSSINRVIDTCYDLFPIPYCA